jgi:RNA-directed DNA polymerase
MTNTENKVQCLRTKLADKAKREPKFRFYSLYGHIYRKDVLQTAWEQVKKNGGCPGIDNVSLNIFDSEEKIQEFLISLQEELKNKTYRPSSLKRVMIPKSNGKLRPLGIPTVKDRVVQAATRLILEPIFEADFHDCSYGFRPNRSAHQALHQIQAALKAGKSTAYDADLKGYFDSIPHNKLMACIRMRVADRWILKLIQMWLKAPVVERTDKGRGPKVTYPKKGTPQGGVISPLLGNIYLHWFDEVFNRNDGPVNWAKATLVRYADDFVILARDLSEELKQFIEGKIESWLGLEINREKTKEVDIKKGDKLNFLGYTFMYKKSAKGWTTPMLCMEPSKEAVKKAKQSVNEILDTQKGMIPIKNLIKQMNKFLLGWANYFSIGYNRTGKRRLNRHARERLVKHIKRRSQRPYRPPEGTSFYAHCKELGLVYL